MDEEIWCDVKGYEGLYQVSNKGKVKSLYDGRHKIFREKILKPQKNGWGYLFVRLSKEGSNKMYTVHRLVLMTFDPNPDMENLQVNHIDEDKTNNRLENLEWVTCKENCNYGTHNDRVAEKLSLPIVQLTLDGKYIRSYKSSHEAEREGGFHPGNIIQCCKGKRKTHKGYKWQYLHEVD